MSNRLSETPARIAILDVNAPAPWVSMNDRSHWHAKAKLTKRWRTASAWQARAAKVRPFTCPVRIRAVVHKATPNRYDAHNLAPTAKAVIDGLVDAGVLAGDDNDRLVSLEMAAGTRREVASLVLYIEAVPASAKVVHHKGEQA